MTDPPEPTPPDDPEQSATETRFAELLRRFWRPDQGAAASPPTDTAHPPPGRDPAQ